jgi:hypothetical protein
MSSEHGSTKVKVIVKTKQFQTTLHTLKRFPDSFFGRWASRFSSLPPNNILEIKKRGNQFFQTILDYLASGPEKLGLEDFSRTDLEMLAEEAEYYELPGNFIYYFFLYVFRFFSFSFLFLLFGTSQN